jgi:hypothetical protein
MFLLKDDTTMFWGVKSYNDLLMQADPTGYAQTELFFSKGQIDVYFQKRLSLPRTIYFNGDSCVMPPPNDSLELPNAGTKLQAHFFALDDGFGLLVVASIALVAFIA